MSRRRYDLFAGAAVARSRRSDFRAGLCGGGRAVDRYTSGVLLKGVLTVFSKLLAIGLRTGHGITLAEFFAWVFMISNSRSSSRPGLSSTPSGIPTLPMSWRGLVLRLRVAEFGVSSNTRTVAACREGG